MNIYIWQEVEHATDSYHSEGGVVVFAESEEKARELANSEDGCVIKADEIVDMVLGCDDCKEKVFIFPNAGCC